MTLRRQGLLRFALYVVRTVRAVRWCKVSPRSKLVLLKALFSALTFRYSIEYPAE